MNRRREEFGERGGDGDHQRLLADETDIGFDDMARCRQGARK